jgi:hypothetical protein
VSVTAADLARFESKTAPEPNTGCLLWTASRLPRGYGEFGFRGRVVRAHKWLYEQLHGPVPAGLVLDHKCRTPSCVNPDHLEPVTQRVNVLRGTAPAALQAQQESCIHGHPLSGANLYTKPNGARQCKACRRDTDRRRRPKGIPHGC